MLTVLNISSKVTEPVKTKFHEEPPGMEQTKICSNRSGHINNMAARFIYGKTLKKLLLYNQLIECLENWYIALSTPVLSRLLK